MKTILWLTEGFPIATEPYTGDGIERRAKAVSIYNRVFLIYVKKNKNLKRGEIQFEERIYNENFKAFIYQYPSIGRFSVFLDFFLSNYYFFSLYFKAFKNLKREYGKPDGIQVNIAMKVGAVALYYKWKWRIKYIVVESWSWVLPEEQSLLRKKGWMFRFLTQKVYKNATQVVVLSKHLGEMINQHLRPISFKVIPNVVDKTIFFPSRHIHNPVFRFIHISNLAPTKNIEQIVIAFAKILQQGYKAELLIHAPSNELLTEQIKTLKLEKSVILKDEARQQVLADSIRSSDALILFSLYETFGNVIIEAQACGVPVITSDYPTFFEIVEDGVNGVIAKGKDASALVPAMIYCIKNRNSFDSQKISSKALQLYSFERIGKMFDDVYSTHF